MKGPGIQEYLSEIEIRKQEAHNKGEKYIDVNSKMLHQDLSKNHATMPTCCQAMYKLLLNGDEIIQRPKGITGFGSHLTVRYYVDNLVNREKLMPAKKRGRPSKSLEEKERDRRAKTSFNTDDLIHILTAWLKERSYDVQQVETKLVATKDNSKWIIDVQGVKRGRKQPLTSKINHILKQIEDDTAHYSLAFNDSSMYRKQWNEIPNVLKTKLNVSVILTDKSGKIQEVQ